MTSLKKPRIRPGPLGASVSADGVTYRVWAPSARAARVLVTAGSGAERELAMRRDDAGYHEAMDPMGRAGDAYVYSLDGGRGLPDPVSRAQREGVHGPSVVVDPSFPWTDKGWKRPDFRDLVIYEIHIGTFSAEGTFAGAIEHLEAVRELGVNAIQLMPLADFPGDRNWGYDGVLLYAPARCHGSPEDLRRLVDRAHALDMAVILDVVYNHFGPSGNYLREFSPHYFTGRHHTPWGEAVNFDSADCGPVRGFFLNNIRMWMREYHIDGFRLDATHEIPDCSPTHILAELTAAIAERGGYAIAEDPRNEAQLITERDSGGLGFGAVWADDFHHVTRVSQTGERFWYFEDFTGSTDELVTTLEHGWLYRGQVSPMGGKPRGTVCRHLPPERFVHCISNHDQSGNRAFGERLSHMISPAGYRALSALLCLSPYTPMLFMGQEWGASAPFLFFTDHDAELGVAISKGRKREMAKFPEFADEAAADQIPDPQDEETFLRSRLNWGERDAPEHAGLMELYRACLALRREQVVFRPLTRSTWRVVALPWGAVRIVYEGESELWALVFSLRGGCSGVVDGQRSWRLVLSSEEGRFGGDDGIVFDEATGTLTFPDTGLVVLRGGTP